MQCITTRLHRRENYATVENRYDELGKHECRNSSNGKTFHWDNADSNEEGRTKQ